MLYVENSELTGNLYYMYSVVTEIYQSDRICDNPHLQIYYVHFDSVPCSYGFRGKISTSNENYR